MVELDTQRGKEDLKNHRTAWIAGGAAAAVVGATLHGGFKGYRLPPTIDPVTGVKIVGRRGGLIAAIKASGRRELLAEYKVTEKGLQHAANVRQAKEVARTAADVEAVKVHHELINNPPIHHGETASEIAKKSQYPISPGEKDYANLTLARTYANAAAKRHAIASLQNPAVKDFVYWSKPFNADNPPKQGRFVHPDVAHKLNLAWSRKEAERRVAAGIVSPTAAKYPEQVSKALGTRGLRVPGVKDKRGAEHPLSEKAEWRPGKKPKEMARQVMKLVEFDVRLKEGRGSNGQFTSGDAPPLTPRDLQYAYHVPIQRKLQQAQQPSGPSKTKKAVVAGIGGAIGLGILGIAAGNAIRKKSAQAIIKEAEESAMPIGEQLSKGSRELVESSMRNQHKATLDALQARHDQQTAETALKHAEEKGALATELQETQAKLRIKEKVEKSLRASVERHKERTGIAEAHVDTYAQVEAGGAKPVLVPQDFRGSLEFTPRKPIFTHTEAIQALRTHLKGDPANERHLGKIGGVLKTLSSLEKNATEAAKQGKSDYHIAGLAIRHKHQLDRLAAHTDHLTALDKIPKITDHVERELAIKKLAKAIQRTDAHATEIINADLTDLRIRRQLEPKKPDLPFGDVVSISQRGFPAVEGKGVGGPGGKKKNTKNYMSDTRLAIRLCRTFAPRAPFELRPHMIELGIGGEPILPKGVFSDIEQFLANRRAKLGKLNLTPRKKIVKPDSSAQLTPLLRREH